MVKPRSNIVVLVTWWQESLFHKFRNQLLNVDANAEITPVLLEQECVVTQQMLCHLDDLHLSWQDGIIPMNGMHPKTYVDAD